MRKISQSKNAFTLAELVAAIAVIALVVLVTLPITIGKMKKTDNVAYFMAYSTMQDIAANIVSQNPYDVSKVASFSSSKFSKGGFKYLNAAIRNTSPCERNGTCPPGGGNGPEETTLIQDPWIINDPVRPPENHTDLDTTLKPDTEIDMTIPIKDIKPEIDTPVKYDPPSIKPDTKIDITIPTKEIKPEVDTPVIIPPTKEIKPEVDAPVITPPTKDIKPEVDTPVIIPPTKDIKPEVDAPVITPPRSEDCAEGYTFNGSRCVLSEKPITVTECRSGFYHNGITCVPFADIVVTPPAIDPDHTITEFEPDDSNLKAITFCDKVAAKYNYAMDGCSMASVSSIKSAALSGDFKTLQPHLVLQNGLRLFIGSDVEPIPQLAGADKQDRVGFVVYVDINGDKGKGRLYNDVFPFYLLVSGKMIPGYSSSSETGALSAKQLGVNVLADEYSAGGARTIKVVLKNADYRKAVCTTGYIKSATYCAATSFDKNTALQYDLCKDNSSDCRVIVNKPFRLF